MLAANLAMVDKGCIYAQDDEGDMRVSERDETGKAIRFNFNFISRDLRDLIRFLSQETDLTFVASENEIKDKKFALTNLKNVTMDEMLEEVKTVLSTYNLTTIRDGNTVLITTFEKAVQMKVPVKRITAEASQVEVSDEIQTYIIQLENAVASELVGGLRPLLNKAANIFADANSNSLVITDVASNVRRIATILQVADEAPEAPLKVEIVPLQNATASSLAATLNQVFQDETQIANVLRTMGDTKDPERDGENNGESEERRIRD